MQSAETVLDIARDRGRRGLPCDELYRQLFNLQVHLHRYCRYANDHLLWSPTAPAEVRQVTKLDRPQTAWTHLMARMLRKTLVVCIPCHQACHARQATAASTD